MLFCNTGFYVCEYEFYKFIAKNHVHEGAEVTVLD